MHIDSLELMVDNEIWLSRNIASCCLYAKSLLLASYKGVHDAMSHPLF